MSVQCILSGQVTVPSVSMNATLLATNWSGTEAPYTQDLAFSGLTAAQNGILGLSHAATIDQRKAAREAELEVIGQRDGFLTVAADGKDKPEENIPTTLILLK